MAECASCGEHITDTAVICRRESDRLAARLRQAADLWEDLELAVARQTRMGTPGPRPRGSTPASPIRPDSGRLRHYADQEVGWPGGLIVDLRASDVADAVRNTLTTWARVVADRIGADPPSTSVALCGWLAQRLDWVRYQEWAPECLDELDDAQAQVARAVDRPAPRAYLGPCGVPDGMSGACTGEMYARRGAEHARCPACGTSHPVAARRDWLDGLVREHCYTASEIADAYGVRAERIRQWAARGRIAQRGQDQRGRPLYALLEVLELVCRRERKNLA